MPNNSLIDFFQHPPFGVLSLEHFPTAPFNAGTWAVLRMKGPIRVDAFGVLWTTSAAALGIGSIPGLVTEWEERVVEIAITHQFLDGTFVVTQRVASNLDVGYLLFDQLFPYSVDIIVGPGFLVDFYWILAF